MLLGNRRRRKGRRKSERRGVPEFCQVPARSPEHLHPSGADVDIMTAPFVIDKPVTHTHKHSETNTYFFYYNLQSFVQSVCRVKQ